MPNPSHLLRALCLALAATPGQAQRAAQAPTPALATQQKIEAAIDSGARFLLGTYASRISAGNLETAERIGQSALTLYTLLKCGVPKDDPTVRRLLVYLQSRPIDQTYDASLALLALSAHGGSDNLRWIDELARRLVAWQLDGGDWSYPSGGNDLSNTQFAALALWIAASDGVAIDTRVWTKLTEAVFGYQTLDGGFGYGSGGGRGASGTGSMTAAGAATLAMCEIELRIAGACSPKLAEKFALARSRSQEWLAKYFSVTANPKAGAWLYYYLYGLERFGAVCGVARLGEHDWYGEGAAFLLAQQAETGAWQGGTDLSETCFALLFLKRATLARRGPATGEQSVFAAGAAPLRIAGGGSGPLNVWIEGWNRKLVREIEWSSDHGLGPRVVRVEYLADDKLIGVQLGDSTRGMGQERFAARLVFDITGKHSLKARVIALAPNVASKTELVLESPPLEVEVAHALPRWIGELDSELGPNLCGDPKNKAKASSSVKAKDAPLGLEFPPESVLDGSAASPWLADAKDEQRTLTISFQNPVECNVIRISPAVIPALGPSYLSRPVEVEIEINGKDKQRLAMDPDPLHPMRLELARKTLVKRLDLRILASAPSPTSPLVGIGEIELFLRKN